MQINVVFVIRCLYSAVSLTLVKEQRFIRIIYNYYIIAFYWSVLEHLGGLDVWTGEKEKKRKKIIAIFPGQCKI